jgi:hypothetical protein
MHGHSADFVVLITEFCLLSRKVTRTHLVKQAQLLFGQTAN